MAFKRTILSVAVTLLVLLSFTSCESPTDDKIGEPYEYYSEEEDVYLSVDEYGRVIERTMYDMQGGEEVEFERRTYEYNENGDIVREDYYTRSKFRYYIVYEYDADNKLERRSKYSADGYLERVWYDYCEDVYGEQIPLKELYYYEDGGGVYYYIESKINSEDTKKVYYNTDGSVSSITEEKFDLNGNLIDSVTYDADGNVLRYAKWEYDDRGRKIKYIKCYDEDGKEIRMEKSYHDNGRDSEEIWYRGGVIYSISRRNKAGDLTQSIHYNDEGVITWSNENCYNDAGQLIKAVYYNPQTAEQTGGALIEIEYFENERVKKETCYDEDRKPVFVKEYISTNRPLCFITYNKNGTFKQRTEWKYEKIVTVDEYVEQRYPSGQKILVRNEFVDYVLLERVEYEYDDAGNIIQLTKYDKDDNVIE